MIYCKSGYLHMGEIYTSFVVRLKPRKMPPGVYGKKKANLMWGKWHIQVFNTYAYCLTPKKCTFISTA